MLDRYVCLLCVYCLCIHFIFFHIYINFKLLNPISYPCYFIQNKQIDRLKNLKNSNRQTQKFHATNSPAASKYSGPIV